MERHEVRDLPRDRQAEARFAKRGNHRRTFERLRIAGPDPTRTAAVSFLMRTDRFEPDQLAPGAH